MLRDLWEILTLLFYDDWAYWSVLLVGALVGMALLVAGVDPAEGRTATAATLDSLRVELAQCRGDSIAWDRWIREVPVPERYRSR